MTTSEQLGAVPTDDATTFTVWAPYARRVEIDLGDRSIDMTATADGYHHCTIEGVTSGQRYGYRLDGGDVLPDPATRSQPDGLFAPSEVIALGRNAPPSRSWAAPNLDQLVLYEIHVGTFTSGGTFTTAIAQLDHLASLGINALELMPINQFPGARNWGYDGVYPFAAQNTYGGRAGLIELVDAAHARGIAVFLDVVHNHVGPEGNMFGRFGPYFTDEHQTPWGPAINVAGPNSDHVRRFYIDSAVEWITNVGIDGLRLDAVHAIVDPTASTFLAELCDAVHAAAASQGREAIVIAESSANDPLVIRPTAEHGQGCDAVWNDDFHHGLRVALTGERPGYYEDYRGVDDLVRCFEAGWTFEGRHSLARGRRHGKALTSSGPDGVPFHQLIVCDQNHDQIGNRAAGERLDVLVDPERRKLAAAAVMLSPFTPMLFMGEEYGERAPFPFFIDHSDPGIVEATRTGRRAEFPDHAPASIPDPASPDTFASAILDHTVMADPPHLQVLEFYRDLLLHRQANRAVTAPDATTTVSSAAVSSTTVSSPSSGATIQVIRHFDNNEVALLLHFADEPGTWASDGWTIVMDSSDERYGGPTTASTQQRGVLAPWSAQFAHRSRP